jgi:nicotinamidase-related amidase
MDPVSSYLEQYGRVEEELLSGKQLNGAGVFDGEREFIELGEQAYNTDQHGAFRIRSEECALIVVDMQEDLVNPTGPMCIPEAYRQLPRIKRLIQHCRTLRVPVFYTEVTIPRDAPHDYHSFFPPLRDGAVREGAAGTRVHHELKPEPEDRVIDTKYGFDSFNGTPLDRFLRYRGVRTVIICGTLTNFCCETTARSAYGLGYHVVFGSDVTRPTMLMLNVPHCERCGAVLDEY